MDAAAPKHNVWRRAAVPALPPHDRDRDVGEGRLCIIGPMLKRLLSIWLFICVLGYGTVWAFDSHLHEPAQPQGAVVLADHAIDGEGQTGGCDHCCHATAHVLALWASMSPAESILAHTASVPYLPRPSFALTSPPDRPPRA